MSAAPRNDEMTCIDALVTGIEALTDGTGGAAVKAFPQGCDVVPEDRLDTWLAAPESNRKRHVALIRGPVIHVDTEGPVSRVEQERFNLGFVVMVRQASDTKRNWRDALNEQIDLFNRVKNQITTDIATLLGNGTISPLTDGHEVEWGEQVDAPDIPVEWIADGQRFTLGNQVGGARTH